QAVSGLAALLARAGRGRVGDRAGGLRFAAAARGAHALAACRLQRALDDLIISIGPEAVVVAGRPEHVVEQVVGELRPEKLGARGGLSAGRRRGARSVRIGGLLRGGSLARGTYGGRVRCNMMRASVTPVAMRQQMADGPENRRENAREG